MTENKVAIYVRKSTESEDRQVLSIESQMKELKEYAGKMGWRVIATYSESKSAKAPGREIFNQLYQKVQQNEINELLCWKLDRLARNPVDGGALIWAMEEKKLQSIHTPQRSFYNSGNDKFWLQLEFGMAKKYVDDLSDNVKRGLKTKIQNGWYPSKAPLGYLNDKETKTITPDPERFDIVRSLWDLMLTGIYTPPQILKIANEKYGLRTKLYKSGGGNPVAYSYIYEIFNNPFYYGAFRIREQLYQGKHKPMVTKEEFNQVQKLMASDFSTRPKAYEFAYTGLIKCGECGASITAEHKTNRRYGCKYIYYHCTKRKGRCSQKYIQEPELNEQFLSFIDSLSINENILQLGIEVINRQRDSIVDKNEAILRALQKRITETEKDIAELLNIKLRRLISDQDFLKKKAGLEDTLTNLNNQKYAIEHNPQAASDKSIEAFQLVRSLIDRFNNGQDSEKKAIIAQTGSNLTLTNKTMLIQAKEPFNHFQKFQVALKQQNARFEPRHLRQYNTQTVTCGDGLCAMLALVENVRTFFSKTEDYAQNSGDPTKV